VVEEPLQRGAKGALEDMATEVRGMEELRVDIMMHGESPHCPLVAVSDTTKTTVLWDINMADDRSSNIEVVDCQSADLGQYLKRISVTDQ